MRLTRTAWVVTALAPAVLSVPAAAAQEATWALTNARIETVTRGAIERGTIIIRDGLIAAVGANVAVPTDARVVDLSGRTVYPGIIDLTSSLGLPSQPAAGGGGGGGGGGGAAAAAVQAGPVGIEPERMVADELRPNAADIRTLRDAGITAVLTAPSRGAFRGQSVLVPVRDSVDGREAIRGAVALHMGFQGVGGGGFGGGRYPGTLLGVIAYERQALYDAQRQGVLLERYQTNPRGMERPANDPALAALVPVVRGQQPVFFAANGEGDMTRAMSIAREFNLQLTLVGATEGFRIAERLAALRRPVVVSLDFPQSAQVTGWQYRFAQIRSPNDSATHDSLVRRAVEGNAAALNRAGVRFALASGGTIRASEFMGNVRKAIAAGLHHDTALAALTIRAAEIAGVAAQLGSIEEGKIANLVVTEGDLLGDSGKVRMVFVDGIRYEVTPPPPAAGGGRGRAGGGGGAAAQVAGTWDVTITTPQGSQNVTMALEQSGATFTGTMTSPMGVERISGGEISGSSASWSLSITMGGQSVTISFRATIDGNRMNGQASMGEMGTMPFTAEKRP
jgi:imidazolonepropionase-like amidohydrolase